jgi:hypothetical protein
MPMWMQHLLVLLLVGGCFAVVAVQGVRSLRGKKSKLGSCCAKGCSASEPENAKPEASSNRVVFLPADMLTSSRRTRGQ